MIKLKKYNLAVSFLICGLVLSIPFRISAENTPLKDDTMITITIAYNNIPQEASLTTAWGFSALVESPEWTLLFDTGGDGDILLGNLKKLGASPSKVSMVVLSHTHSDHAGGLSDFLEAAGTVHLVIPDSFTPGFQDSVRRAGHQVTRVSASIEIVPGVLTTDRMGQDIPEQGLILQAGPGPVLITGCAHPGIAAMTQRTASLTGRDPWLVLGGFHLASHSPTEVRDISRKLRETGVKKIGPSHCTGPEAMDLFRKEWGDDYLELGLGGVVQVPLTEDRP